MTTPMMIDTYDTISVHAVSSTKTEGHVLMVNGGSWTWVVITANGYEYKGTAPNRAAAVDAMLGQMVAA